MKYNIHKYRFLSKPVLMRLFYNRLYGPNVLIHGKTLDESLRPNFDRDKSRMIRRQLSLANEMTDLQQRELNNSSIKVLLLIVEKYNISFKCQDT